MNPADTRLARSGAQILVDALKIHGVDMAFGVPGESYLAVLDSLHDSDIRFIICRQEGGAANMADVPLTARLRSASDMPAMRPQNVAAWASRCARPAASAAAI